MTIIKTKDLNYVQGIGDDFMYYTGEKIRYYDSDAVVLTCQGDEVLIYISERYIKWVSKALIEIDFSKKLA